MSPPRLNITHRVPLVYEFRNNSKTHEYFGWQNVYEVTNLTLLVSGVTLNATLILVTLLSTSMKLTSLNCYLLSMICSNLILLSDVLNEVLLRYYGVNFQLNLDYVSYVTFEASVLTLAMLHLDRYVLICRSSTFWGEIIPTVSTALKSVAVIWYMSTMTTAMQLHLHNRMSEETFGNIFVSATVMFTVLPSLVSVFLATLIFYDRKTYGTRDVDQAETLLLLGGLTIGVLITMLPLKTALVINFLHPSVCCSLKNLNIYYMVMKASSAINPAICFLTSTTIFEGLLNVFCRCRVRRFC